MENPSNSEIREKKVKQDERTTLHEVFGWTILFYQIFGLMPVCGIFNPSIYGVRFTWISLRSVWSLASMIGFCFMTGIQMTRFFKSDIEMVDILRLWYFLTSLLGSLCFFQIARNWLTFLKEWNRVDKSMVKYGWPKGLKKRVNSLLAILMVFSVIQYFLVQLQKMQYDITSGWPVIFNMKVWNHYQKDFKFKYVYELVDYDFVSGMILVVIQVQVLMVGTFLDLFIMVISLALAARIEQVAERIKLASASMNTSENIWEELREDYNRLASLCKYINEKIGPAITLSFATNLGIILIQLFNSLEVSPAVMGKLYLYYAFGFVMARTIAVCLIGAKINDDSQKPLTYLYKASDSAYNVEIDRMIRQLTRDDLAFSGMKLFSIRRNLFLQIAGSIVTYELVVIQFAGDFLKEHQTMNNSYSL